jgi:endonuclease YncB( thermonuclease family)
MNSMVKFSLFAILSFFFLISHAQVLQGKVVKIADGDSFTILTDGKMQVRVRMHGIDAPEKGQAYSQVSKQYLSNLIFNQKVTVEVNSRDKYRRVVGMVFVGDKNINETMLSEGLAWHFIRYDKNKTWSSLQEQAKRAKKGLWKDANPIAPWDYRKSKKS